MSAALITLFAVFALGALSMAIYGFRVLVGRWEQPRTPKLPRVEPLPPIGPALAAPPPPAPAPPPASRHVVPIAGWNAAPAPRSVPPPPPQFGVMATPFPGPAPMQVPPPPSAGTWAPPPPVAAAPERAASEPAAASPSPSSGSRTTGAMPAFLPRTTRPPAPPVHEVSRFARGSIPPEVSPELLAPEHDDEDAVEFADEDPTPLSSPQPRERPIIQRGARFSVIRSSRR